MMNSPVVYAFDREWVRVHANGTLRTTRNILRGTLIGGDICLYRANGRRDDDDGYDDDHEDDENEPTYINEGIITPCNLYT